MDWTEIRKEFETTDVTLKELAAKHGISEGTMRSRKNREKWQRNVATQRKKKPATNKKNVATRKDKKTAQKARKIEVEENPELTDKQRLFVAEYLIEPNATQAAIRAGYSEKNAGKIGHELLEKTRIYQAIENGISQRVQRLGITADKVLQQIAKIGFADIKDVVSWSGSRIRIRPSDEVDGTILAEIIKTETQFGGTLKVKLNDRMKALEMMARHLNLFNDRHKENIEEEKLKIEQQRLELEKIKVDKTPEETPSDDGFIEALNASAVADWGDYSEDEESNI